MQDIRKVIIGCIVLLSWLIVAKWLVVGLHNQEPTDEGFDFNKKEDVQAFLQQFERIEQ